MTDGEFRKFLRSSASLLAANSEPRSMHFICMDFRTTRKRSILCLPWAIRDAVFLGINLMYLEFSGLEWAALFLIALMILGPMEAGATHASQQGWDQAVVKNGVVSVQP